MRKLLIIIIVIIIAVVSVALFYYQRKLTPSAPSQEMPSAPAAQQPTKALPFDSNDNINQALDDLKTLNGFGIQ